MSRFRTFLAWLIMLAIPLQGLAASSMLFCGMAEHHAPSAQQHSMKAGAAEHGDHSKHAHAAPEHASQKAPVKAQLPDASHKCGVCASCCHSMAIAAIPPLVAFAPAPQADLVEPFVLIQARPAPVPDKPPRA